MVTNMVQSIILALLWLLFVLHGVHGQMALREQASLEVMHEVDIQKENRSLQADEDEYPVPLEPFHIVYHHHPERNNNFEGMEEMNVLAATRSYLMRVLWELEPNTFQRVLIYLFVRFEDEQLTKVAYSGTAYFSTPSSQEVKQKIQNASWMGFLGNNKTKYLQELKQFNIVGMDDITLLNVAGNLVGIDSDTGAILTLEGSPGTVLDEISQGNGPPDTSMSSSVSMTLYLCAIIIPVVVFAMIIIWWIARKLRHDILWKRPVMSDEAMWQASRRLERRFMQRNNNKSNSSIGSSASQSQHRHDNDHTFSMSSTHHDNDIDVDIDVELGSPMSSMGKRSVLERQNLLDTSFKSEKPKLSSKMMFLAKKSPSTANSINTSQRELKGPGKVPTNPSKPKTATSSSKDVTSKVADAKRKPEILLTKQEISTGRSSTEKLHNKKRSKESKMPQSASSGAATRLKGQKDVIEGATNSAGFKPEKDKKHKMTQSSNKRTEPASESTIQPKAKSRVKTSSKKSLKIATDTPRRKSKVKSREDRVRRPYSEMDIPTSPTKSKRKSATKRYANADSAQEPVPISMNSKLSKPQSPRIKKAEECMVEKREASIKKKTQSRSDTATSQTKREETGTKSYTMTSGTTTDNTISSILQLEGMMRTQKQSRAKESSIRR